MRTDKFIHVMTIDLVVLSAVYFDDQTSFEANAVEDVGFDRHLPLEFEAAQSMTAHDLPELPLGVGGR